MPDTQYQVLIGGDDFSDCISMEEGYNWTCIAMSADSATGQITSGDFFCPILGERVQLAFKAPEVITKTRLYQLADALNFGTTGQRESLVTYDDPLFGKITQGFYCTNIPWIKKKLPNAPYHYGKGITWQLASTSFIGKPVAQGSLATNPVYAKDKEYKILINGNDFSDCFSIDDGYKGQIISQSLESQTGMSLDGKFSIPIIGERTQLDMKAITALEVDRFRMLGKALQFGTTGERTHTVAYEDMIHGQTTQNFYCTQLQGHRKKYPKHPYHYMEKVSFTMAMKSFYK